MERITAKKEDRSWQGEEFWVSACEPDAEEVDKVYDRLAELEDKLENGELIEIKPLDMPTWEEVRDSRKRIIYDLGHYSISKLGNSIYGLETGKGICAQFTITEEGYMEACKWADKQRRELIKELCGE